MKHVLYQLFSIHSPYGDVLSLFDFFIESPPPLPPQFSEFLRDPNNHLISSSLVRIIKLSLHESRVSKSKAEKQRVIVQVTFPFRTPCFYVRRKRTCA